MCDATPGKENTRRGAAKIKSSAGVSARSNPVQSTEKNAPSTTRPSRIRFDIHRHSEEDQRPDLPLSCICQVTRVWRTDQNSGRPPFFSKRGKRTQHDKQRDGQMAMIDTLGEHTPPDCSPSLASILIGMWIVNTS